MTVLIKKRPKKKRTAFPFVLPHFFGPNPPDTPTWAKCVRNDMNNNVSRGLHGVTRSWLRSSPYWPPGACSSHAPGSHPLPSLVTQRLKNGLNATWGGGWPLMHPILRTDVRRGTASSGPLPGSHPPPSKKMAENLPGRHPWTDPFSKRSCVREPHADNKTIQHVHTDKWTTNYSKIQPDCFAEGQSEHSYTKPPYSLGQKLLGWDRED